MNTRPIYNSNRSIIRFDRIIIDDENKKYIQLDVSDNFDNVKFKAISSQNLNDAGIDYFSNFKKEDVISGIEIELIGQKQKNTAGEVEEIWVRLFEDEDDMFYYFNMINKQFGFKMIINDFNHDNYDNYDYEYGYDEFLKEKFSKQIELILNNNEVKLTNDDLDYFENLSSNEMKYHLLNEKFMFGKYKGKSVEEILESHPSYISWCILNVRYFWLPITLLTQNMDKISKKAIIFNFIYIVYKIANSQIHDERYSVEKIDWEREAFEHAYEGDIDVYFHFNQ